MDSEKDTTTISLQKVSINLPDDTRWSIDDGGDIGEFIDKEMEFIKSPEFLSSILPALFEQFVRRYKETVERLAMERPNPTQAGKCEPHCSGCPVDFWSSAHSHYQLIDLHCQACR